MNYKFLKNIFERQPSKKQVQEREEIIKTIDKGLEILTELKLKHKDTELEEHMLPDIEKAIDAGLELQSLIKKSKKVPLSGLHAIATFAMLVKHEIDHDRSHTVPHVIEEIMNDMIDHLGIKGRVEVVDAGKKPKKSNVKERVTN